MNKTILIFLFISQFSFCQVMSIEEYSNYVIASIDIPENITATKDVNGVFHPYLGEWQSQVNGNSIKLVISENTYSYPDGLLIDQIVTRFEIKDANGNIIKSTLALADDSVHLITFDFIDHTGVLQNIFIEESNCGIVEQIYYKLNRTPGSISHTSMTFHARKNENFDNGDNCPNGNTPSTFPLNQDIVFTKI
ncbi:MAG: hypothetical protein ACSHWW_04920 [Nonlabens sp.]|uniref:hypothetical protein n=1 Tax=Nonlabens sp. TaxID=1888209 RepID=UPI003EF53036